jgi:hypothetical protein
MGIDGLNGYAKRMIEKGMREMASAMKKSLRDITKHEGGGHDQAHMAHGQVRVAVQAQAMLMLIQPEIK